MYHRKITAWKVQDQTLKKVYQKRLQTNNNKYGRIIIHSLTVIGKQTCVKDFLRFHMFLFLFPSIGVLSK